MSTSGVTPRTSEPRPAGNRRRRRLLFLVVLLLGGSACTAKLSPWKLFVPTPSSVMPDMSIVSPGVNVAPTSSAASTTCCINGAFYDCPDYQAGMRCTGNLGEQSPDPSSCRRDPSRDATCS